jgi:hypothetical protein
MPAVNSQDRLDHMPPLDPETIAWRAVGKKLRQLRKASANNEGFLTADYAD